MARPSDFVDPEYDRKLAEFKEKKARMKMEMKEEEQRPEPRRRRY